MSNMVGVGVLTTAGYLARDLSPRGVLAAWLVGGLLALAGARAYAALARLVPRSGGEYRFLAELLHPAVGYLAGWTSLLVGFAAPLAVAALTAGAFVATLVPALPPRLVGSALILLLTLLHGRHLTLSTFSQNLLAAIKALLLAAFVAVGLGLGEHHLPAAAATTSPRGTVAAFMIAQVYIAFAYSGWNAATYAAAEFREPSRTVPRALLLGTGLVTLFYLAVNWVFVANLTPARLAAWTRGDTLRITLAHLVVEDLAGPRAARLLSLLVVVSLIALASSLVVVGPRVYGAMAEGGLMPRRLAPRRGEAPLLAVLLQNGLALLLLWTHSFDLLLRQIGALLTLVSALTCLPVLRLQAGPRERRPGWPATVAAAVYVLFSGWMLIYAIADTPSALAWVLIAAALGLAGYRFSRGRFR